MSKQYIEKDKEDNTCNGDRFSKAYQNHIYPTY